MQNYLENHCDGSGPHGGSSVVRAYPIGGGGNLHLCRNCCNRENNYRKQRGIETGAPDRWPVLIWDNLRLVSV